MKKIYPTLSTPYYDKAGEIPWNVYPRPQFKRNSFFCLNGSWDFRISLLNTLPRDYFEKILVPFPPESKLSRIEKRIKKDEILYYRRKFTLPEEFYRGRIIIHFGAVDCLTEVFINGCSTGKNEGGYLPFSFDITDFIRNGENEITVKVKDGTDRKYPYGKQKEKRGGMWYTPVSGIWQSVWIERVPENYIKSVRITADCNSATITVIGGEKKKTLTLTDSGEVYEFEGESVTLLPSEIHLWQPEAPYLYYFTLKSGEDEIESYFALREISVKKSESGERLLLNGKPYLFSGLLDQGYFPDGIFLPPTPDGYADDIMNAKRLGFNMLRKHIKIEPMIFYHLCDKLGIAVFQDMVNNGSYSFILDTALPTVGIKKIPELRHRNPETRRIFKKNMLGTADLLYNCPSVVEYTVFNEGWGQYDAAGAYRELKAADKTRVIDAASGWFESKASDFDSRHIYFRMPVISNPNGKPLYLSEFGGYSLRIAGHLFGEKNYGYKVFENPEDFAEAVKQLYTQGVLPLVKMGLGAAVYTQLSDVEDETNGLMTYDRKVIKINPADMRKLNELLYRALDELNG